MTKQSDFEYFECKVCGFTSVQAREEQKLDRCCPLCMSDCGHLNVMSRRIANDTDKPEGRDARKVETP